MIERPQAFEVNGRLHYIHPITYGKSHMISCLVRQLDTDASVLAQNASMEALRLASTKRSVVATIVAYSACSSKEELFDAEHVAKLVKEFEGLCVEDLATLLCLCLGTEHTDELIKHFGIDAEMRWMRRAEALKNDDDNTEHFCGKSQWGGIIDWACERYGWTMDYVLWGISLTNLQMLMSDYVKTMYLTEEEHKHLHRPKKDDVVVDANKMSIEEFAKHRKEFGL